MNFKGRAGHAKLTQRSAATVACVISRATSVHGTPHPASAVLEAQPLGPFLFSPLTGCSPQGPCPIFKSSITIQLPLRSAKNIISIFFVYILTHLAPKTLFQLVATRYFILQTEDFSVSTVLKLRPVRSKLLMLPEVSLPSLFPKGQPRCQKRT